MERSVYQREPSGAFVLIGEPDQTVGVDDSGSPWQDYLVVRERDQFARVLAVVEVLSRANKSGNSVPRYREKRMMFLASRAHFMEIETQ